MGKSLSPVTIVEGLGALASPPTTYTRLVKTIEDPFSSAEKIAKVVSDDPDVTARLLRIVNSSYYGFPRRIETVSHAVALVGTDQLKDLTLATTVLRAFGGLPSELIDMEAFWKHSVACGLVARLLAYRRREPNPERFFVAGLLHDIGRLILYLKLPKESAVLLEEAKRSGELLHVLEQKFLKFDHGDVGAALMEAWNLPEVHRATVRYHHRPSGASSFPAEVATVHVADVVANSLGLGTSGGLFVPPLEEEAWDLLGLPVDVLRPLVEETEQRYGDTVKFVLEMAA